MYLSVGMSAAKGLPEFQVSSQEGALLHLSRQASEKEERRCRPCVIWTASWGPCNACHSCKVIRYSRPF